MRYIGLILAVGLVVALAFGAGCSCEDPQAADPEQRVVTVPEPEPQPSAEAEPAEQQQRERADRERQVGESVLHAPADYLRTTTVLAPRAARRRVNLAQLQNEIERFWGLEGRYPQSLEELEQWREAELPEIPAGYEFDYDPSSGQLDLVRTQQQQ